MTAKNEPPNTNADEQRARADAMTRMREKTVTMYRQASQNPGVDAELLHELRVYQIQLEMQNEELRRAQTATEQTRERLVDLYDFAPVGYCTTNAAGVIIQANLTLSALLGWQRNQLLTRGLSRFILKQDQDAWYRLQKNSLAPPAQDIAPTTQTCELHLLTHNDTPVWVSLTATVATGDDGEAVLRLAIVDIDERKQAQSALKLSQGFLRSLVESTTDAIFVKDVEGRYLEFNSAASRFVGKPVEEVLGKDDTALFPMEQARQVMAGDRTIMASGRVQTIEEQVTTAVGITTFLATKGPVLDAQGQVIGLFGISRDISARKKMELAMQASETRYRALVEHAPYCIHEIDLEGRLTSMNNAGLKMMGVDDVCAIQGMAYLDAVSDRDHDRIASLMSDAFTGQHSEFIFQTSNGLHFQSVFVPIKDDKGVVERLMGLTIDITERKLAESTLLASETRFRNIIDLSPIPYALNDEEQHINYINIAFTKTFGYESSDIPKLEDWWAKAYPDPNYRRWVADTWQSRLNQAKAEAKEFEPLEINICCKDGSIKTVLASAGALTESFIGLQLVILYDITERKLAEDKLRQHKTELQSRNDILERFNQITVGRELQMIELKREVNDLCAKLNEPPRHRIVEIPTPPQKS